MSKEGPSDKAVRALFAIDVFAGAHKKAPTFRELMRETRVKKNATLVRRLVELRDAGLVIWESPMARTLTITKRGRRVVG